jgi:hypothetical protein
MMQGSGSRGQGCACSNCDGLGLEGSEKKLRLQSRLCFGVVVPGVQGAGVQGAA